MSPEEAAALDVARALAAAGIPVFTAPADPGSKVGFRLPPRWQQTPADPRVVDTWQPGMAMCMVTGRGLDVIDVDPRNGADVAVLGGLRPRHYAAASTPSAGAHLFVASLGVRTKPDLWPGIDIKAGDRDGRGAGFVFIAPTVKPSKVDGRSGAYRWMPAPDPAELSALLGGQLVDTSGAVLAQRIGATRGHEQPNAAAEAYDGPPHADLSPDDQRRLSRYTETVVDAVLEELDAAATWPPGHTDERGRGWEKLTADAALKLGRLARAAWSDLDLAVARELLLAHAPTDNGWRLDDAEEKWRTQSARLDPLPYPRSDSERDAAFYERMGLTLPAPAAPGAWAPLPPAVAGASSAAPPTGHAHNPRSLRDAHLSETVAGRALRGRYLWSGGLGWMRYRAGCWSSVEETDVLDVVRRDLIDQHAREAAAGADKDRLKELSATLSASRIGGLLRLAKGVVGVESERFDAHPHLLCVGNGVVDLSTGELLGHDPDLLLTRRTSTPYLPGAASSDWAAALAALPNDVVPWLQQRLGQAATGHPTSDDVLPVLQGSGSNGKTTLMGAVVRALGEHAVTVPERVLMAHPSDHPTELMTLRGARLALIEETPEGRKLPVKRLKDVLGTPTITARAIRRDNVTWQATHSLVLTTNYTPVVAETDHGTWRRLALLRFPYTFVAPGQPASRAHERPSVAGIRERLLEGRDGAHEAVLAWIVAGARSWYAADRLFSAPPGRVVADTLDWRENSDLVLAYIHERLVVGAAADGRHVASDDLAGDFNSYVRTRGHQDWSQKTFLTRFADHESVIGAGVRKARVRGEDGLSRPGAGTAASPFPTAAYAALPTQYSAWIGVRFRGADEDAHEGGSAA